MILAKSKAGHDKDQVYLVIKEDEDFVYLVNGETKKVDSPKKKKKIHVQPIIKLPLDVEKLEAESYDDILVKRILKLYNRRNEKDV